MLCFTRKVRENTPTAIDLHTRNVGFPFFPPQGEDKKYLTKTYQHSFHKGLMAAEIEHNS
jgi:hypothetical protein